jgi:hypothetical protein
MGILKDLENLLREMAEEQMVRPPATRPRPQPQQRPQPLPELEAVDAEVIELQPLGAGVSQHVSQHLDMSSIRQHTAQLGSEVALADDKLDARLHDKFDHAVGRIKGGQPTAAAAPPTATVSSSPAPTARPSEIAQLLRNPKSIRQAIILNEILRRPEW